MNRTPQVANAMQKVVAERAKRDGYKNRILGSRRDFVAALLADDKFDALYNRLKPATQVTVMKALNTFKNHSDHNAKHADELNKLLDRYGITGRLRETIFKKIMSEARAAYRARNSSKDTVANAA